MPKAFWRSPLFVLICATGIILVGYGSRQSFGMFLRPVTEALGWGADVRVMSLSTGLQALIYGLAAFGTYTLPEAFVPEQVVVGDPITVWDAIPAADWVLPEMFPQRNWELPEMFLPEQTTPTSVIPAYGPR